MSEEFRAKTHNGPSQRARRWGAWVCLGAMVAFLLSPTILYSIVQGPGQSRGNPVQVWNLLMSFLWMALLHASFRRLQHLHLLLAPFYLTTAADLFLIYRFGSRFTGSYVSIVFTDFADAGEFARAYGRDLLVGLPLLLALYGVCLRGIRGIEVVVPTRFKAIGLAAVLVGYWGVVARQMSFHGMDLRWACMDVAAHDLSSPLGVIPQVATTLAVLARTQDHAEIRRRTTLAARKVDEGVEEIFVLAIGESARPDHWSVNGYSRDTTPRLRQQANLVFLSNVVTTSPSTSIAIPSLVSLAPISDWTAIQSTRSVVSAFREVGFETYWLSTQEVSQWGGTIHNVAEEAGTRRYFDRKLDGALVEEVRRVLSDRPGPRRLLFVLHTKGSHFEFVNRYPAEFRAYADTGGSRVEDLVNAYDNSIRYTDWVLAEIIDLLAARGSRSVLLYTSDHGENLLDDGGDAFGHAIGNRYDVATAAFVWFSDPLAAQHPRKFELLRSRAAASVSISNFSHSLLDVAGIEATGLDRTRSIFSETFRETPRLYSAQGKIKVWPREPPLPPRAASPEAEAAGPPQLPP